MKSKINKYFFQEFLRYFSIVLFALVSIIWISQAVNFLDLVIEDGHTFSIYFYYTLLSIPKIITKLMPFSFLTALILTILKLEKDNELIVLWTSGLNKIRIVNLIFIISILALIIQLTLASTITPSTLNLSRSMLKDSTLEFFPSLIKEKQFNDTVQDVTFFIEKKSNDGSIKNIFIRDKNKIMRDDSQKSSTIIAKSGFLKQTQDERYLILFNGSIQKENLSGKLNFINFEKIILSLDDLTTKSITQPKIQETSSFELIKCVLNNDIFNYINYEIKDKGNKFECEKNNNKNTIIELNRRFGMPLYIPILALIGSFLLSSRQEHKMSGLYNFIYPLIGFFILVFAEISIRYSYKTLYTFLYYSIPIFSLPIVYFILIKTFKYENLKS